MNDDEETQVDESEKAQMKKEQSNTIRDDFEKENMSVLFVLDDPKNKGSLCSRTRVFPCVVGVPKHITEEMQMEEKFFGLFSAMRSNESHRFEQFIMPQDMLDDYCNVLEFGSKRGPPKKLAKHEGDGWESTHQELFLFAGIAWPPPIAELDEFRTRSAECVYFANYMFPETELDRWQFFDSNHDCKRLFRWPRKEKKKKKTDEDDGFTDLKNPWRPFIPTMTALSNMVARVLRSDDSGGEPKLTIRRVHPLECMRVMGWDLPFYAEGPFGTYKVPGESKDAFIDADLLGDMVGNAWCAWTFAAIKIALVGCIDWKEAMEKTNRWKQAGCPSPATAGLQDKQICVVLYVCLYVCLSVCM